MNVSAYDLCLGLLYLVQAVCPAGNESDEQVCKQADRAAKGIAEAINGIRQLDRLASKPPANPED